MRRYQIKVHQQFLTVVIIILTTSFGCGSELVSDSATGGSRANPKPASNPKLPQHPGESVSNSLLSERQMAELDLFPRLSHDHFILRFANTLGSEKLLNRTTKNTLANELESAFRVVCTTTNCELITRRKL